MMVKKTAVLAFLFLQPVMAWASALPALRPAVTVSGEIVRLGDLFTGAGAAAAVAVFRAPDPGQTGKVPVAQIIDLARANGLQGIERAEFAEVAVSRSSRAVSAEEVTALVRQAFAKRPDITDAGALSIALSNSGTIHFADDPARELTVAQLTWASVSGQFQAELAFGAERRTVNGTAQDVVHALVATRNIARDAVIGPEDVALEARPRAQAASALNDDAPVLGKAARRPLRAGQMVALSDVTEPELVKRAAIVTLVHRKPGMVLTARGQALRSGRRGETITVMNLLSKRVIEGQVTGPDEVTILAAPRFPVQAHASTSK